MKTFKELLIENIDENEVIEEFTSASLKSFDVLKINNNKIIVLKYNKGDQTIKFANFADFKDKNTPPEKTRIIDAWMINNIPVKYIGNYKSM